MRVASSSVVFTNINNKKATYIAVLETSDFGLFWHDSCRYKVDAKLAYTNNVVSTTYVDESMK